MQYPPTYRGVDPFLLQHGIQRHMSGPQRPASLRLRPHSDRKPAQGGAQPGQGGGEVELEAAARDRAALAAGETDKTGAELGVVAEVGVAEPGEKIKHIRGQHNIQLFR